MDTRGSTSARIRAHITGSSIQGGMLTLRSFASPTTTQRSAPPATRPRTRTSRPRSGCHGYTTMRRSVLRASCRVVDVQFRGTLDGSSFAGCSGSSLGAERSIRTAVLVGVERPSVHGADPHLHGRNARVVRADRRREGRRGWTRCGGLGAASVWRRPQPQLPRPCRRRRRSVHARPRERTCRVPRRFSTRLIRARVRHRARLQAVGQVASSARFARTLDQKPDVLQGSLLWKNRRPLPSLYMFTIQVLLRRSTAMERGLRSVPATSA